MTRPAATLTPATAGGFGALAVTYAVVWAATAAGIVVTAVGRVELTSGAPRDALPAHLTTALEVAAANAPVALWPLALLALGWHGLPIARPLGDVLITGQLLGHGLLVGSALATHPVLWRYLPHLPVEWLALALPVAAWLAARRNDQLSLIRTGLITVALVGLAGLLETYAVPL